jgi:hypothetical protein
MSRAAVRMAVIWLAGLMVGSAAAVVPASPAFAATWSVVTTPNATSDRNQFNGIDAVSTTDAWAAGYAIYPSAPQTRPLLARWNGTSWSLQATPAQSGDAFFDGVDGNSGTNVWAVGGSGTGTLTERWNGSAWSVVPSPNPAGSVGASLRAVKSLANNDAWAVGTSAHSTGIPGRTLIEHWNGTSWSIVSSPNPDGTQNLLRAVDGVAANDVWAVGATGHDGYGGDPVGSLVLHWNGSAWSQVTIPGSGGAFSTTELTDVVAISANDVWAVGKGFSFTYFQQVPYLLHYNGTTWTHSTIPNPPLGRFNGVTALSASKVYAVGDGPLIARWNGSAWNTETVPGSGYRNLLAACAIGTSTVWAAGIQAGDDWVFRTFAVRATNA